MKIKTIMYAFVAVALTLTQGASSTAHADPMIRSEWGAKIGSEADMDRDG